MEIGGTANSSMEVKGAVGSLGFLGSFDDGYGNMGDSWSHANSNILLWMNDTHTFGDFLRLVNNPEDVKIWFKHYDFNMIFLKYGGCLGSDVLWQYKKSRRDNYTKNHSLESCAEVIIPDFEELNTFLANIFHPGIDEIVFLYHVDICDFEIFHI